MLVMIALIGTTVAPWQLFFQQSNVVDKRITTRWLSYERADTAIGTVLFAVGAVAVLVACAIAFDGTAFHGDFTNAGAVARDLRDRAGPWAGALFAVALLNGSVLGAGAVTLSASYTIGDVTGPNTLSTVPGMTPDDSTAATPPSSPRPRQSFSYLEPRWASSPSGFKPSPASSCPAPWSSCFCLATTAPSSDRGSIPAGSTS